MRTTQILPNMPDLIAQLIALLGKVQIYAAIPKTKQEGHCRPYSVSLCVCVCLCVVLKYNSRPIEELALSISNHIFQCNMWCVYSIKSTLAWIWSSTEHCWVETSGNNIDASLKASKDDDLKKIKLLLLGAGESGKSAIFKQIKMLYGARPSGTELAFWKQVQLSFWRPDLSSPSLPIFFSNNTTFSMEFFEPLGD